MKELKYRRLSGGNNSIVETQEFCGIRTRECFQKKILIPMIQSGKILIIPASPNSLKKKCNKA